ncbi:MAG: PEGA domain-containing protein [Candidatus Saccharibacteria bacterium]|nr:PEGA domain-containing protein [Candidatus Saccharibacteria bacterium]
MDPEQQKKRQTLRILFSEAMMVLSVIIIMTVLIMITSGYWINQNFEVERRGMLEVFSAPTGADIIIDGESDWLAKTNNSRIVSKGEHLVTIKKEGYGDWSKKVTIEEGLMYRIPYVRLFPIEAEVEKVSEIDAKLSSVSPNRNLMLLINDSTTWKLLHLDNDKANATNVDVSGLFGDAAATIIGASWSADNNRVLLEATVNDGTEWFVLDLKDASKNISLTKAFGMNFDTVEFFDKPGDNLLVIDEGELRKININEQSISKILASKVTSFNIYENSVVYISGEVEKKVSVLKKIDDAPIDLYDVSGGKTFAALTRSYRDNYLTVISDSTLTLYKGKLPRDKNDKNSFEKIFSVGIDFVPEDIHVGGDGDFVAMRSGKNIAALDMESENVTKFEVEDEQVDWLDGYMLYVVDEDGDMVVYDFDGLNRRELSKNASKRLSATVTEDRWLYYFSDGWLVRENLTIK